MAARESHCREQKMQGDMPEPAYRLDGWLLRESCWQLAGVEELLWGEFGHWCKRLHSLAVSFLPCHGRSA